ncbi:hypothetical protein [Pseudomonas phage PPpW-3]|uniref:Uncharacterized protein n=1 Tax=Pseudomonas phage PPpW-3 TaxID=1279082 RepID=V5YTH3_9CAUD|nr:head closure Hc1 [Pseudomonas phage PPpW-3]BAO20608.1 hypothetical protein [Pseudomonas phage PPpW-3]
MRGPSWENLDDFLQTDDDGGFAQSAVVQFRDGETRTISVIYDDPYLNAQLGEYEADTSEPRISGKEVDMVGIRRGDFVTVAGETFDVLASPEADGTGWALVRLAREGDQHAAI